MIMINTNKIYNKIKKIDGMLLCGILAALIALVSLGWIYIVDGGIFTLRDDFNVQQIPFTAMAHNNLLNGFDGWCWELDLGTSLIQGLSFYNLGSPFFWVTMLFPAEVFPYLVGILYILKYIVAAITAYMYINLFTKRNEFAIFGALLYAFSGFQASNLLFYHFHDVVALFPLMLYGMEKAMEDRKNSKILIFAVFINALLNYFFFVQEAVFLVIYFVARFLKGSIKVIFERFFRSIYSCLLGMGMAAILLLPNIMYILDNQRAESEKSLNDFTIYAQHLFYIIKGLVFPGEAMHDQTSVFMQEWSSTSLYLPLVGLSLVLGYIFTKRDWLSGMLKFLFVASIVPILSSSFLMFTESTRRWWFLFSLMMALASSLALENRKSFKIEKGIFANIAIVVGFYIIIKSMPLNPNDTEVLVMHPVRMAAYFIFSLSGLILVFILLRLKKMQLKAIIAFTAVFAIITTASTAALYKRGYKNANDYKSDLQLANKIETINDQYRYNNSDNVISMVGSVASTSSFSSTINYSILKFDKMFDFHKLIIRMDKNEIRGLSELLAAKYQIVNKVSDDDKVIQTINTKDKTYYILENPACPIGFAADSYILYEDIQKIKKEDRGIALLDASVIYAKDEEKISNIISKLNFEEVNFEKSIEAYVKETESRAVTNFSRSSKGFLCDANYDKDSLIYFSVPFDEGWTAYVDGIETDIINSGGMILLPVSKGEHNIEFKYNTPGFKTGMYISIVSFLIYAALLVVQFKNKKGGKSVKKINEVN